MESVDKWLRVRAEISKARKTVLQDFGLNEDSLKELEARSTKELYEYGGDYETEDGVAYLYENEIYAHKNSQVIGTSKKIKTRRKG